MFFFKAGKSDDEEITSAAIFLRIGTSYQNFFFGIFRKNNFFEKKRLSEILSQSVKKVSPNF